MSVNSAVGAEGRPLLLRDGVATCRGAAVQAADAVPVASPLRWWALLVFTLMSAVQNIAWVRARLPIPPTFSCVLSLVRARALSLSQPVVAHFCYHPTLSSMGTMSPHASDMVATHLPSLVCANRRADDLSGLDTDWCSASDAIARFTTAGRLHNCSEEHKGPPPLHPILLAPRAPVPMTLLLRCGACSCSGTPSFTMTSTMSRPCGWSRLQP